MLPHSLNSSSSPSKRYCQLGCVIAISAVSIFSSVTPARAGEESLYIGTGVTNRVGLGMGMIDPSWSWNASCVDTDPRYSTYTENLNADGTWIMPGGETNTNDTGYGSFDGVACLYTEFVLPDNAFNVNFNVGLIAADDRVVLSLNGNNLGGFALPTDTRTGYGMGVMTTGGGVDVAQEFQPNTRNLFFNDPNLFVLGGSNLIKLWVNNIGLQSLMSSAIPIQTNTADRASVYFQSQVSFTTPSPEEEEEPESPDVSVPETPGVTPVKTPEPGAILGLIGFVGCVLKQRRK